MFEKKTYCKKIFASFTILLFRRVNSSHYVSMLICWQNISFEFRVIHTERTHLRQCYQNNENKLDKCFRKVRAKISNNSFLNDVLEHWNND